jgi:hypothetical protein
MNFVPYYGNAKYCYANATAMLLATIGEQVAPGTIEVLTGVGLGAARFPQTPFLFSMQSPDDGITQVLQLLGFTFVEQAADDDALARLRVALTQGPCVLGPIDMGYLTYHPNYRHLAGADHFVLAYKMTDTTLQVHDPDGYPYVSLPFDALMCAWKAERIGYSHEPYRLWRQPERQRIVSPEELYRTAAQSFQKLYHGLEEAAPHIPAEVGSVAIHNFAQLVQTHKASSADLEMMQYFSLALGAKRAIDYATFFTPYNQQLAQEKDQQAQLFGLCHSEAVRCNWSRVASLLEQLAESEARFREVLMGVR